jgi:spoIIIJ-associated protein
VELQGRRSVVASGKTVEDAIANGLIMLGVRRDQVDVEILHPGSRGLLGIGAEDARVQLAVKLPPVPVPSIRAPREQAPTPEMPREPVSMARVKLEQPPTAQVAPEPMPYHPELAEGLEPEAGEADASRVGQEILAELLKQMGFQASVEMVVGDDLGEEGQPSPWVLNIKGDDLGVLIGRRGETLGDLQYLLRLMVSHRVKRWTDLVVDVESYRSRRRRALESLAARVAERVIASGRSQALEPMPAYERRLVHIALRNHPQVTTESVGVGEKRKVTIIPRK